MQTTALLCLLGQTLFSKFKRPTMIFFFWKFCWMRYIFVKLSFLTADFQIKLMHTTTKSTSTFLLFFSTLPLYFSLATQNYLLRLSCHVCRCSLIFHSVAEDGAKAQTQTEEMEISTRSRGKNTLTVMNMTFTFINVLCNFCH